MFATSSSYFFINPAITYNYDGEEGSSLYFLTDSEYTVQPDDVLCNRDPELSFEMTFTQSLLITVPQEFKFILNAEHLYIYSNPSFFDAIIASMPEPQINNSHGQRRRLLGSPRLGLSWDAVSNMMNTRFREQGIGLTSELAQTKKFRFKHMNEAFTIMGMSYNFAVLLGFHGLEIEYPISSKANTYTEHYANGTVPVDSIVSLTIDAEEEEEEKEDTKIYQLYFPLLSSSDQFIQGVIPYEIVTADDYPPLCRLEFQIEKDSWNPPTFTDWFAINSSSGSLKLIYKKDKPSEASAMVKVNLHQGDSGKPLFSKKVRIHGQGIGKSIDDWQLCPAKKRIVFDEKIRVGLRRPTSEQSLEDLVSITWWIPDHRFLKFSTPVHRDGTAFDDGRTVIVQALHHATTLDEKAEVKAEIVIVTGEKGQKTTILLTAEIEIISDQVEYQAQVIEAPYIGVSLSTPQLYLTTNIGYQVFKNSMLTPKTLDSVQVAAVLQNTFSPGMYMSGQGDFPITMNDADSSNLTFTLCDANYHPIKLLSPMYVILKLEPTPNPVEDISQWNQFLPRVRKPQVPPIYYQVPRLNITEHPDLLAAWLYPPDII
jgi:hypothetical protein